MRVGNISDIKFVIANDKYPDELQKGEGIEVDCDSKMNLILGCPACGKSSYGSNHVYHPETKTVTPSIVHVCGWHGYLKNGIFSNA